MGRVDDLLVQHPDYYMPEDVAIINYRVQFNGSRSDFFSFASGGVYIKSSAKCTDFHE